jgi:Holliday junction resolvase RusA-like endonuclease
MIHTFVLPVQRPLLTTNQARSQHWRHAHRAKHDTETLVRRALARARIQTLTAPITVSVTWYAPDARRRDSDALDFTKKAILDALVKTGRIPDDDWRHVRSSTTAIELDRDHPRIEITITEENQ